MWSWLTSGFDFSRINCTRVVDVSDFVQTQLSGSRVMSGWWVCPGLAGHGLMSGWLGGQAGLSGLELMSGWLAWEWLFLADLEWMNGWWGWLSGLGSMNNWWSRCPSCIATSGHDLAIMWRLRCVISGMLSCWQFSRFIFDHNLRSMIRRRLRNFVSCHDFMSKCSSRCIVSCRHLTNRWRHRCIGTGHDLDNRWRSGNIVFCHDLIIRWRFRWGHNLTSWRRCYWDVVGHIWKAVCYFCCHDHRSLRLFVHFVHQWLFGHILLIGWHLWNNLTTLKQWDIRFLNWKNTFPASCLISPSDLRIIVLIGGQHSKYQHWYSRIHFSTPWSVA